MPVRKLSFPPRGRGAYDSFESRAGCPSRPANLSVCRTTTRRSVSGTRVVQLDRRRQLVPKGDELAGVSEGG